MPAVELHGRVHALGEPVQVARHLEEVALGDVGRVDEVVAGLHVALPRVVLHETPDGAPLGMEHGEARADLLGEAEEVELCAELAVVAPLRLLELVQVGGERLLGLPGGPVDALQLLALLVAPPVGAGDPHQLEVAEAAGGGHVRPPAQVDERVGVAVGADHRADGVHLVGPGLDGLDDLLLEGLVGEDLQPFFEGVLVALEGLVLLDDGAHLGLDPLQVVVAEVGAAGQLEVVVEAVLDDRADGVLGARPEPADGLGHDVGGGVPEDLAAGLGVPGHDGDRRPVGQRRFEVHLAAVDGGGDGRLGQAGPDGTGEFGGRRALGQLPLRAVGKTNRDDAWHRAPFLAQPADCSWSGRWFTRVLDPPHRIVPCSGPCLLVATRARVERTDGELLLIGDASLAFVWPTSSERPAADAGRRRPLALVVGPPVTAYVERDHVGTLGHGRRAVRVHGQPLPVAVGRIVVTPAAR